MMRQPQRRANWGFSTTAQPGLNGRAIGYPRETLGGCAAVNGMIAQMGQPDDYDYWGDLLGDESWGRWDAMRPHFDRLMDYQAGERVGPDGRARGSGGPQTVSRQRLSWDVLDRFADACVAAGIPRRTSTTPLRRAWATSRSRSGGASGSPRTAPSCVPSADRT
ncbi:unnamed protein product [Prorocentrum cordatum]|uniref:Glucose-methanol-choline oxidoreductase N-terminal domain-containing protein n=1 Tax=Prorocentrum cordatum TaxID=2364126 RepID=A0ABN9QSI6_9DINO|nr:unnamed protein product [Polarella glacialis]